MKLYGFGPTRSYRLWTVTDLAALVEAVEPKLDKRPYKKRVAA
jgi:hypothetical protein